MSFKKWIATAAPRKEHHNVGSSGPKKHFLPNGFFIGQKVFYISSIGNHVVVGTVRAPNLDLYYERNTPETYVWCKEWNGHMPIERVSAYNKRY